MVGDLGLRFDFFMGHGLTWVVSAGPERIGSLWILWPGLVPGYFENWAAILDSCFDFVEFMAARCFTLQAMANYLRYYSH